MKTLIKLFLICTTLLLTTISNAQDQKSFTITNISKEVVWPALFSAFKELKLPRPLIATQQGIGETRYYNYTSLMIKNRLRFKINYQAESLTISIFGRQYYTKSGWADNPLPMSKKQAAKILIPIKEKIEAIINTLPTIVIIKEKTKVIVKYEKETTSPSIKAKKELNQPTITKVKEPKKTKKLDPTTPEVIYIGEGGQTTPKPISSTPVNNDNHTEIKKVVSNSTDKQSIISLAHEAMGKIKKIEDKIKGLQSVANEANYLKIGNEIQNFKKEIVPIKKRYVEKINKIAEKRTISYNIKKTDPVNYYSTKSLTVYGAHWEMNHITILLDVSFTRIKKIKKINDQPHYEHLQYFSCEFIDNDAKSIAKAGIPLFTKDKSVQSFGIGFSDFEKECKYVDFKYSEAKLTRMN